MHAEAATSTFPALTLDAFMLAEAAATVFARAPHALVLANSDTTAVLTLLSLTFVLTYAAATTFLARTLHSFVLADTAPATFFTGGPLSLVLTDTTAPTVFAQGSHSFVFADATTATVLAQAALAAVLAAFATQRSTLYSFGRITARFRENPASGRRSEQQSQCCQPTNTYCSLPAAGRAAHAHSVTFVFLQKFAHRYVSDPKENERLLTVSSIEKVGRPSIV